MNRTVSPFLWCAGVDPSVPRSRSLSSLLPRKLYLMSSSFIRTMPLFSNRDASWTMRLDVVSVMSDISVVWRVLRGRNLNLLLVCEMVVFVSFARVLWG